MTNSKTTVSTTETSIEPRQPRRLEKKKNIDCELPARGGAKLTDVRARS
jgi:hypothetical protein